MLFEPAEGRRVVQLTAERALEDAEMRGGAERQEPNQLLNNEVNIHSHLCCSHKTQRP